MRLDSLDDQIHTIFSNQAAKLKPNILARRRAKKQMTNRKGSYAYMNSI